MRVGVISDAELANTFDVPLSVPLTTLLPGDSVVTGQIAVSPGEIASVRSGNILVTIEERDNNFPAYQMMLENINPAFVLDATETATGLSFDLVSDPVTFGELNIATTEFTLEYTAVSPNFGSGYASFITAFNAYVNSLLTNLGDQIIVLRATSSSTLTYSTSAGQTVLYTNGSIVYVNSPGQPELEYAYYVAAGLDGLGLPGWGVLYSSTNVLNSAQSVNAGLPSVYVGLYPASTGVGGTPSFYVGQEVGADSLTSSPSVTLSPGTYVAYLVNNTKGLRVNAMGSIVIRTS